MKSALFPVRDISSLLLLALYVAAASREPAHAADASSSPQIASPRAVLVADDAEPIKILELDKWSTTSKVAKIESGDPKVKNAVRFTVEEKPKNFWNASLDAKAPMDIRQGSEIQVAFWLRAPEGDGSAKIIFSTWEQKPSIFLPRTGFGEVKINHIGPQWTRHSYQFTAKKGISAGDSRLRLMFGDKVQTVDVGGVSISVESKTGDAPQTAAKNDTPTLTKVLTGAQTPGDTSWLSSAKIAATNGKVDFFGKPGQTWGFLGDSLTHSSFYHQYLQLFLETRYPGLDFWTVNAGRSGDTASGAIRNKRLDADLKSSSPSVVFLHFGMNDVKYFMFDKTKYTTKPEELQARQNDYIKNLTQLVNDVKAMGAQPVLIAPTIYENSTGNFPGVNEELAVYAELGAKLAEEKGVPFFDINAPLNRFAAEKRADSKNWRLTNDNVHPKDEGYQVMSYLILKGLQPQPFVYRVEVNAAKALSKAEGAEISDVTATPRAVSFSLLEKSLPFPVTAQDKGLKMVPFATDLNRQNLKILGLAPGAYDVRIDGQSVVKADAKALGEGIDLASIQSTPQYQQALKVRELILPEKFELERAQRDMASVMYGIPDVDWANADDATGVAAFEKWVATIPDNDRKGWKGYLIGQGRKNFPKRSEIAARLAEIRAELVKMPTKMKHVYDIVAA